MANTVREAFARSLETDIARLSEELDKKRADRARLDAGQLPRELSHGQRQQRVAGYLTALTGDASQNVISINSRRPRSRAT